MLVAVGGVLRQTLTDDELQLHRHAAANSRQRLGLLADDLVRQRLLIFALERPRPGNHLVENAAHGPDIGPMIDLLALQLLRAHVGRRPDRLVALGQP